MCRRLVMIEGAPTLSGSSPNLTANYSVKCIIFPRAKGGARIRYGWAAGPLARRRSRARRQSDANAGRFHTEPSRQAIRG